MKVYRLEVHCRDDGMRFRTAVDEPHYHEAIAQIEELRLGWIVEVVDVPAAQAMQMLHPLRRRDQRDA